ncbi:MAG: hypothetical protein O7F73_14215 [Gammaproteobacteria bacterium]|nr:hypothetical protein [Gammaproteobacteria bacterium]
MTGEERPRRGGSPAKKSIIRAFEHGDINQYVQWSVGKRPQEELYKLSDDPEQLNNLAADPVFGEIKSGMREILFTRLTQDNDTRISGGDIFWPAVEIQQPASVA